MKKKNKSPAPKKRAKSAGSEAISSSTSRKEKKPYFGALKKLKYAEWHKSWLKGLQVHANSGSGSNGYYIQDILLS